jgi:hypothetical protein
VIVDLKQLAFHKIRVSEQYNTAQIKRALIRGIRELDFSSRGPGLRPVRRRRPGSSSLTN